MPEVIPEKYRDLFEKRAFANLGTLMPDGLAASHAGVVRL